MRFTCVSQFLIFHVLQKFLFPGSLRYFCVSFSNIFVLIQLDESSISLSAIYRRFNSELDRCSFVTRTASFISLKKQSTTREFNLLLVCEKSRDIFLLY